jgi:hypothetical protein
MAFCVDVDQCVNAAFLICGHKVKSGNRSSFVSRAMLSRHSGVPEIFAKGEHNETIYHLRGDCIGGSIPFVARS